MVSRYEGRRFHEFSSSVWSLVYLHVPFYIRSVIAFEVVSPPLLSKGRLRLESLHQQQQQNKTNQTSVLE